MKIWMKYLIGAAIGLVLGLVVPGADQALAGVLELLLGVSIRIGRYVLVPLVLFSLPIAAHELNEDKELWKGLGALVLVLLASVVVATGIGVMAASLASPGRIPLVAAQGGGMALPKASETLAAVFPASPFEALLRGDYLLPTYVLALILGLAFSHDRAATKPAVQLFDSLSRIFYQVNSFIAEFLGVFVIVVTASGVLALRESLTTKVYVPVLALVGVEALLVLFGIVPLFLYLAAGRRNPYRALYGLLGPALAALASGDAYFALGSLVKHAKESLGVRRRANMLALPLALALGRAGSALVTATAFVIVLSSYSSLGIPLGNLLWILAVSPILAVILGAAPGGGAMAALVALCALYGKGFENGYLIALPIALPLSAVGALLDTVWAGAVALAFGRQRGYVTEREARFHI